MFAKIEFNPSAFKHGSNIDADSINVFHAMPCRKSFYGLLGGKDGKND
jgi:hypothetical protein